MISAKEVNERAHMARAKIEAREKVEKARLRAAIDTEIAPALETMLLDIERVIKKAMDAGAYAIEYPVEPLKGVTDAMVQRAYREGLLTPLREAGFNAGFPLNEGRLNGLSIRWEGAS